ncbi:MAG: hypothetical protein IJT23_06635 [Clostridia bacterium]|nr:hypothetical protein [Clostridia bacterium]
MSQIKNNDEMNKALENGYKEMAKINSELAQDAVTSDNDAFDTYVDKLLECD